MDLQIVREHHVAGEIGHDAEGTRRDHHRHDGEAVEAVREVHGVARCHDDEGAEQDEEPAEIDQQVLEEGEGEGGDRPARPTWMKAMTAMPAMRNSAARRALPEKPLWLCFVTLR